MRKIIALLSVIIVSVGATIAQKNIAVTEQTVTMSMGERTGYSITLQGVDEKDLEKALKTWIGEMQKKADISESGKHEIMAKGITIPSLGPNPSDIYFLINEGKNDITVTGFFNVDGAFVSSSTAPDKTAAVSTQMQRFGMRVEKIKLQDQIDDASKDLSKRKDEQSDLEKKNKQLNDQIDECRQTIEKAESDLKENAGDQEKKKSEISDAQKKLDDLSRDMKQYDGY